MTTQNKFPRTITASLILLLAAGAANADSPVNATETVATQKAPIKDERGHRHRHGPPGKGWVHYGRHYQPAVINEAIRLKNYGPPSMRLRVGSGAMLPVWRHNRHTGIMFPVEFPQE